MNDQQKTMAELFKTKIVGNGAAPSLTIAMDPLDIAQGDDIKDAEAELNKNYILFWNHVGLEMNRLTHSEALHGPQQGPPLSARALGILHIAIHDAYFAIKPSTYKSYLPAFSSSFPEQLSLPDPAIWPSGDNAAASVAGAAFAVLQKLYTEPKPDISTDANAKLNFRLEKFLRDFGRDFGQNHLHSASFLFGVTLGNVVFTLLDHPQGAEPGNYKVRKDTRYAFYDEPTNPLRVVLVDPNHPDGATKVTHPHHAPIYGETAKRFATHKEHFIADPPGILSAKHQATEYGDAIKDVYRMGGNITLPTTKRTPSQTAKGLFWAYDGANLIGTPPRLYNQILRCVAVRKIKADSEITSEANNADFARLFALANTAMADAGIFAWREKYYFDFWRPLSGVRNETEGGHEELADPFWKTQGAPSTNSDGLPFKPPFPAYPSGHATFGAACFQIARLFYRERDNTQWGPNDPDDLAFDFVSEELNGYNRDLYQPYKAGIPIVDQPGDVRTKVERSFSSLWEAIFENALSRIWLGVHWRFDACAAKDVLIPTSEKDVYATDAQGATLYQDIEDIKYTTKGTRADMDGMLFPVGGIGLGLEIANDIWEGGLTPLVGDNPIKPQPISPFKKVATIPAPA
jgi:vanadium chloroperoxidase